MKNLHPFILLTCLGLFLTACGDSTSDEALPEGTTPTEAQRDTEPTPEPEPAEAPAIEAPPVVEDVPQTPATDPIEPASADDAERSSVPGLTYVLPEGWTVGPEKQMRLLTLLPPDGDGADLAISRWPGDVGGFAMNVQRWARQAGLPPIPNLMTADASDYEKFKIDGTTATWIPLMNEGSNLAILSVWVPHGEDSDNPDETWTFKLTCKADQVQTLAPAVRAFCESVKFVD